MSNQAIYRHTLAVRITHWVNVLCLTLLLMSGLQIFNAHPALYIGKRRGFGSDDRVVDPLATGELADGVHLGG